MNTDTIVAIGILIVVIILAPQINKLFDNYRNMKARKEIEKRLEDLKRKDE